jgi:hypothetical protein
VVEDLVLIVRSPRSYVPLTEFETPHSTSRDDGRQTEQLEALVKVDLTAAEVEEISEAGKGRFYRHFMAVVWDAAKP